MRCTFIARSILVVAILCVMSPAAQADGPLSDTAQRGQQAVLVVQFGDDSYVAHCISFSEESITGLELLRRSDVDISTWGAAVCRIEQVGCDYPGERCFCQCLAPPCRFWSYWQWSDGQWIYSQVGAGYHEVHDGDVYGWVWGNGQSPPSIVPSERLCPSSEAISGAESPEPTPVDVTGSEASATSGAEALVSASATDDSLLAGSQSVLIAEYAAFAAISALLMGGFVLVRLRHQES